MNDALIEMLDGSILGEEPEPEISDCTDLIQAESTMARVSVCDRNIERYKKVLQWVADRATALMAREEKKRDRLMSALQPWVENKIRNDIKANPKAKKSMEFLSGIAGLRAGKERVEIEDMEAAVKDARSRDIPVKTVETVSKTDVKNYHKLNGVVLSGTKIVEGDETFYIKTIKGETENG